MCGRWGGLVRSGRRSQREHVAMFLKQRKQGCAASGGAGAATSEAGLGVEEGGWARRRDAAEEDQSRGMLAGAPSPKQNGRTVASGGAGRQSSPGMGGSGANRAPLELGTLQEHVGAGKVSGDVLLVEQSRVGEVAG